MAFYGLDFLFDNQFSGNYGLKIAAINGSTTEDASGGSNVEIFYDSVYRKPTRYQYGVSQNEILSFELELVSEEPIDATLRSKIQKWLFGRQTPCKLQIVQIDLQNIYFNCYLIDSTTHYIGRQCYGFTCTVECDAPWAWQLPKTYSYADFSEPIRHYNDSDNTDYTYPLLEIYANDKILADGSCIIKNASDNGREFKLVGMKPGEVITIDCELQTLNSSLKRYLSDGFNKRFLRLLSGQNFFEISGEIKEIRLTYRNARKVGG